MKQILLLLIFIFCAPWVAWGSSLSQSRAKCSDAFKAKSVVPKEFSDLDSFAEAMTKGLLLKEGEDYWFEFYLRTWFESEEKYFSQPLPSFEKVTKVLKQHPDLSKLPIREQHIIFKDHGVQTPESLKFLIKSFQKYAGERNNNLFNISANWGFWAKMLSFPEAKPNPSLSRKEQTAKQKKDFFEYLETTSVNSRNRKIMIDLIKGREKVILLYQFLNQIREDFLKENKDVQRISQAMADVVHIAGFQNDSYNLLLRSKNSLDRLEGIKKILKERDNVALELGFYKGQFNELVESLNLKPYEDFTSQITQIEKDINSQPYVEKVLRLRALSIQESPFRSCLSGDCATNSYFEKALDPNYYYFTLTDPEMKSSGHITVVLGTAKDNNTGKQVKIAFVDKIQGVSTETIPLMLQGIQLSLKEHGYKLGLPQKVSGSHNGLSNHFITREYVQSELLLKLKTMYLKFEPHLHKYPFEDKGYSLAYTKPHLLEWDSEVSLDIKPGKVYLPQTFEGKLNIIDFIKNNRNNKYTDMALTIAIEKEDRKQVIQLLETGIDFSFKDSNNKTIWMYLSEWGYKGIIPLLEKKDNINLNAVDNNGYTALMYASKAGHTEIVKFLSEKEGMDVNLRNKEGYTALMLAHRYGHKKIAKLLKSKTQGFKL